MNDYLWKPAKLVGDIQISLCCASTYDCMCANWVRLSIDYRLLMIDYLVVSTETWVTYCTDDMGNTFFGLCTLISAASCGDKRLTF
ncbi:MAG: hypothetical protein ACYSWP_16155, partial [Planctomycetota bacterium]